MGLTRDDLGIWMINLPGDSDRRANMDRQLAGLGLDYTLFPAIDGRAEEERLRSRVDVEAYRRNMGRRILPGKMGVYSSHLAVWEQLCRSSLGAGLILEDDVIFHGDFVAALDAALGVASEWDLVRFCCVRAKFPVPQARVDRYRLNAYLGPFTGNAAYLVHSDVAERLLPGLWPQRRALDHELNRFFAHDFRLRGLEPFSCHPDVDRVSTVTSTRRAFRKQTPPWHRRLPYYAQKVAGYWKRTSWLVRRGSIPGSWKTIDRS